MKKTIVLTALGVMFAGNIIAADSTNTLPAAFPVTITVDAGKSLGELKPIWRFFGADEPNYAYMKDGKKLIGELGQLGGSQVYFRAHHLLTSGDGAYSLKFGSSSAYKEDTNGTPIYDWSINDKIFDTYLAARREAVCGNRFHARGALHASAKLSAPSAGE